jgi:transcriptional regulator
MYCWHSQWTASSPASRRAILFLDGWVQDVLLTYDIDIRYYVDMPRPTDLLQGTLDLLIMRILELRALHGVGIADRIEQVTNGAFQVGPGSLFPALHRLAEKGFVEGAWQELDSGRRAKVYTLTRAGRKQLTQEKQNWRRVATAVAQVLTEEG